MRIVFAAIFLGLMSVPVLADDIRVQVIFRDSYRGIAYNDALYFPIDKWGAVTQKEIDDLKTERVTRWKDLIDNPVISPEKTKEELEFELRQVNIDLANLAATKTKLEEDIAAKESASIR